MTLLLLVNVSAHLKRVTIRTMAVLQTPTWRSTQESRIMSPGTPWVTLHLNVVSCKKERLSKFIRSRDYLVEVPLTPA